MSTRRHPTPPGDPPRGGGRTPVGPRHTDGMTGEGSTQDWDAYPPGSYPPPAPGQPVHGPPAGYGQPAYGPPMHGPPPGHGAMHPYGPAFAAALQWPYGPVRPSAATAAAVLGHVTGGLTGLVMLGILVSVLGGDDDPSTLLMLLGIPCAVAIIAGSAALLGRRTADLLHRAAVASVAVLVLVLVVGLATLDGGARLGLLVTVVLALPLPILTAVFAGRPQVRGWVAAG